MNPPSWVPLWIYFMGPVMHPLHEPPSCPLHGFLYGFTLWVPSCTHFCPLHVLFMGSSMDLFMGPVMHLLHEPRMSSSCSYGSFWVPSCTRFMNPLHGSSSWVPLWIYFMGPVTPLHEPPSWVLFMGSSMDLFYGSRQAPAS
ncbi:hypothetical protein J6590_075065 [Homalodisca vitripennis]|nr:hypothetical protein J6590_075065 [Homalodisca vitripennis]